MDMGSYLHEMGFATEQVLAGLWREREAHDALTAKVAKLSKIVEDNYLRAESIAQNALDADDVMLATGMHWYTYFGEDKERHHKSKEQGELAARLAARQFSLSALAGTALQYAEQGISVVHGSLGSCPNGRSIGSLALNNVVWQARKPGQPLGGR